MDPVVRSHGIEVDPPGYLWSKYECFLMSGWWDILHSSCLHVKLWFHERDVLEVRTNKQTERWKLYIPWHKCRGYYTSMGAFCYHGNQRFDPICPKTLCSLSCAPVMLHIKFDQDWLTGFRDIQVWDCGQWRPDHGPLVYYKLTLWAFGSGELKREHGHRA